VVVVLGQVAPLGQEVATFAAQEAMHHLAAAAGGVLGMAAAKYLWWRCADSIGDPPLALLHNLYF
jgi:hypothetical protein